MHQIPSFLHLKVTTATRIHRISRRGLSSPLPRAVPARLRLRVASALLHLCHELPQSAVVFAVSHRPPLSHPRPSLEPAPASASELAAPAAVAASAMSRRRASSLSLHRRAASCLCHEPPARLRLVAPSPSHRLPLPRAASEALLAPAVARRRASVDQPCAASSARRPCASSAASSRRRQTSPGCLQTVLPRRRAARTALPPRPAFRHCCTIFRLAPHLHCG